MPMHSLRTDDERAKFVGDFMASRIFTTRDFSKYEHPSVLRVVFPTLVDDMEVAGVDTKLLGGAFEYYDKANGVIISPYSGHQYPTFPSCNVVVVDEWNPTVDILEAVQGKDTHRHDDV